MPLSYYDVVVLGTSLAPTVCASLLARRGFRVLLLGQDQPPLQYTLGAWTVPRAPFALLSHDGPIARRVHSELGLTQNLRRMTNAQQPGCQLLLPSHRLDLSDDDARWDREVEREFPRVKRPAQDLLAHIKRINGALNAVLDKDLIWPAETFLERRALSRSIAGTSLERAAPAVDPIAELPDHHPLRIGMRLVTRMNDGMDPDEPTTLRSARLLGGWMSAPHSVIGGEHAFQQLLVERLRSHSGVVQDNARARALLIKRGRVVGVRVAGSDEDIGCGHVVAGQDVGALSALLPDRDVFEQVFEHLGEPQLRHYRYTLNIVMRSAGVPAGAARDLFIGLGHDHPRDYERQLRVQIEPLDDEHHNLCCEVLLPRATVEHEDSDLVTLRERLLQTLREVVPFLDTHLCVVDSPHDGLPPDVLRGPPITLSGTWHRGPTTMNAVYGYPVTQALGLCALPLRSPLRRLILCNGQVMPGLGQEGQIVTGWCAAKLITRADRSRAWVQRGMWTRLEV